MSMLVTEEEFHSILVKLGEVFKLDDFIKPEPGDERVKKTWTPGEIHLQIFELDMSEKEKIISSFVMGQATASEEMTLLARGSIWEDEILKRGGQ